MKKITGFIVAALVAAACTVEQGPVEDFAGKDVRLTVLHTSDIHSRILPFDFVPNRTDLALGHLADAGSYGGASRAATILKRERARSQRVLHVDSGDCFQGAPIFNYNKGEAEFRWLSMINVDAVVVGNHEFDAGTSNYAKQLATWGNFSSLAANYIFKDPSEPNNSALGAIVKPYKIVNVGGYKVGVIGMGNLSSLNSIGEGGNSMQITPIDTVYAAQTYVDLVKPQVDLVMIVSHLGLHEDQTLAEKVRGIDVIMGGHLHVVTAPPQQIRDPDGRSVLIVHSGAFMKYVGRLDLVARDGEIQTYDYHPFPVAARVPNQDNPAAVETLLDDADTVNLLKPYEDDLRVATNLKRVIAYAPRGVDRRDPSGGDSQLGNMTAASMRLRQRVDAQFAITNTLGIRDNILPGAITLEEMFNVFPFENTITIMYLSGYEVQELLDFVTSRSAGRGCQSQAQVDGISFVMDCGEELRQWNAGVLHPKNVAYDILINGQPLVPDATYRVATNDYIAAGGSGFDVFKRNTTQVNTGISMRDALIDQMQNQPDCGQWLDEQFLCEGNYGTDAFCNGINTYRNVPCIEGVVDGRIHRIVK